MQSLCSCEVYFCSCKALPCSRAQTNVIGLQADGDALRAAAGSLNAFAADGSFMDQFQQQQEAGAASPPRCLICSLLPGVGVLPELTELLS